MAAAATVREFWRLMAANDFAAVAAVLAEDFVLGWPQTDERIRGALIVAQERGLHDEMTKLIKDYEFDIVPVTTAAAHRISNIYQKWGKRMHPAGLNFGDCFA